MYKSKKQNYPGLYGTFKRIDSSNIEDEQFKHKTPDYTEDENFENLDNLINSLKEKSKNLSEPEAPEPPRHRTRPAPEPLEEVDDEDLDELMKTSSIFDSFPSKSREEGHHQRQRDEKPDRLSDMFTDADFLDELEEDLVRQYSGSHKNNLAAVQETIRKLLSQFDNLSENGKAELADQPSFKRLLQAILAIRDI